MPRAVFYYVVMNKAEHLDLRIEQPPQTLRELVVEKLRQAIISGAFKGGDRLVERTLCDQMGVSRSVIREAVRYLEAEGLVEQQARGGPIVAPMDWARASQIYQIRLLLEADAAEKCAAAAGADVKKHLKAALSDLSTAIENRADADQLEATTRFYELMFTAAGHDVAWEIVNRLNSRISLLRAMTLHSENRNVAGPKHMRKICAAICDNRPTDAAEAVRAHLTDAAHVAQSMLEEASE